MHGIGKDPELADDPEEMLPIPHIALNDRAETHPLLRDLRKLLDSYPGDRMMVGEVYLLDTRLVAEYYGDADELHLSFNFPPLHTPWDPDRWRKQLEITASRLARAQTSFSSCGPRKYGAIGSRGSIMPAVWSADRRAS